MLPEEVIKAHTHRWTDRNTGEEKYYFSYTHFVNIENYGDGKCDLASGGLALITRKQIEDLLAGKALVYLDGEYDPIVMFIEDESELPIDKTE